MNETWLECSFIQSMNTNIGPDRKNLGGANGDRLEEDLNQIVENLTCNDTSKVRKQTNQRRSPSYQPYDENCKSAHPSQLFLGVPNHQRPNISGKKPLQPVDDSQLNCYGYAPIG